MLLGTGVAHGRAQPRLGETGVLPHPGDSRTVVSDGVRLHVEVAGADRPRRTLVVVHGGPGVSHDPLDALTVLTDARTRVVTYDQRGVGLSTAPADDALGLDAHVADLHEVVGAAAIGEVVLVGHSWGALVVLAYLATHDELVDAAVLVTPSPPSRAQHDGTALHTRVRELRRQGIIAPPSPREDCDAWMDRIAPAFWANPWRVGDEPSPPSCDLDVMASTWRALGDYDLTSVIGDVRTPTLVVAGGGDVYGTGPALAVHSALPVGSSELVVLEGCGHRPYAECPVPFFAAVEDFVDR